MKTDGSDASKKQVATQTQQKQGTLGDWLLVQQKRVQPSLPAGTVSIERFMESVKFAILDPKNPLLRTCDKDSLQRSIAQAANYGLEVGGVLGQSYFIPYNESVKNPKTGQWEKVMTCHFQIGYKGLIELARRSKTIKTIAAEPVYANDDFECELASGRSIHHKINIFKDRGEVVAYYSFSASDAETVEATVQETPQIEAQTEQPTPADLASEALEAQGGEMQMSPEEEAALEAQFDSMQQPDPSELF